MVINRPAYLLSMPSTGLITSTINLNSLKRDSNVGMHPVTFVITVESIRNDNIKLHLHDCVINIVQSDLKSRDCIVET